MEQEEATTIDILLNDSSIDYFPEDSNETSAAECPMSNPTFIEYISEMSIAYLIINTILALVTVATIAIFVDELLFLYKKASRRLQRHKAKWLLGIYPVISLTSYISLLAPRASGLNDLVASIFVALCVYIFVVMVIEEYGGPKRMMARLNGAPLNLLMIRPWCLCCKCVPTIQVTDTTLHVLHAMIQQFVLVRPFLGYIITLLWVDESLVVNIKMTIPVQTILGYISSLSSLLAIWSFSMLYQLCRIPLANLQIQGKFVCLQTVLLITGIQRSVISVFVQVGLIKCADHLTSFGVADRYNHMIMLGEMLALAYFARRYYRSSMLKRMKLMDMAMTAEQQNSDRNSSNEGDSYIDVDC